jgi:hypothetical protein
MQLPLGLRILIGYLLLVAIGNLFGLVHGIYLGSNEEISTTLPGFILYVLPAYGLYKQQKWAWFTEFAISSIAILFGLVVLLVANPLMGGMALIIHSAILAYLVKKTCKRLYFEPKGQA